VWRGLGARLEEVKAPHYVASCYFLAHSFKYSLSILFSNALNHFVPLGWETNFVIHKNVLQRKPERTSITLSQNFSFPGLRKITKTLS
jgi:hypothetical protein